MKESCDFWQDFFTTVVVKGALPFEFKMIGKTLVDITMFVPHIDRPVVNPNPNRIPLRIVDGMIIPVSRSVPLPEWPGPIDAAKFVQEQVRWFYRHEADEQIKIGDEYPFIPHHEHL